MIHVAYRLWSGDGFYAKMLGTSMLSMFENTKEKVTVHIMHNDRLTPDNRGKFCYIAGRYNQQIDFRNVEEIAGDILKKFDEVHPIPSGVNSSWYPLIVHEVFPELDKLIFIGADTLFNLDIGELWAYDLDNLGYKLAGVPEAFSGAPEFSFKLANDGYVRHEDYFNADVLLINPNFFRENFQDILDSCKFIYDNGYPYLEQDALNYLFAKDILQLPMKFNAMVMYFRRNSNFVSGRKIYHFASNLKVSLDTYDIYNRLYLEYFLKTPWANVDMFGNIDKAFKRTFEQFFNESRNNLLSLTNLLTKRQRAFFFEDSIIEVGKQIFEIKNDELVIASSFGFEKLLSQLIRSRGEKVFFILVDNYQQVRAFLLRQNFVEGTDFINGAMFLSERHGFHFGFDTRSIVREM